MSERHLFLLLNITLVLASCILFFASYKKSVAGKSNIIYYRASCISCFIWMFFNMFLYVGMDMQQAFPIMLLRYLGIAFMPILMLLHIWHQFSSISIGKKKLLFACLPPAFTCVLVVTNEWQYLFMRGFSIVDARRTHVIEFIYSWGFYLHCVFCYAAVFASILLLLRNFFLVPKHMRKAINLMLCGLTATIVSNMIVLFAGARLSYDITTIGSVVTVYFFYLALMVTGSANLVLTSRDYVWENLSSMILVLDKDQLILDFNNAAKLQARKLSMPTLMEPYPDFRERWIESGQGRVSKYNDDIITFTQAAGEIHYRIRMHAINENTKTPGWLVEISEITEVYELLRYLEASSRYDYLTGLYNRNAFIDTAANFCTPEARPLLVVIGDANGLKKVNDEKGHLAGDKLLQTLAKILCQCAPAESFVARVGGDEFVLLIPRASLEYGKEFIRNVQESCLQEDTEVFGVPRIALGTALLKRPNQTLQEVIEEADWNMYIDKRGQADGETRQRYLHYI